MRSRRGRHSPARARLRPPPSDASPLSRLPAEQERREKRRDYATLLWYFLLTGLYLAVLCLQHNATLNFDVNTSLSNLVRGCGLGCRYHDARGPRLRQAARSTTDRPRRRPPLPQSDPAACEWLRPPAPAVVAGAAGKHHRDDEPADGVDDLQPSAVRCGAVHLRMAQRAGVPRLERPHLRRWRVRGALRVPHVWPERMRARLRHRRAHVAAHHLGVLELHCARLPTRLPLRRCGPHPTAPARRARHSRPHAPLAAGRCSARRSVVAKRSPPPRAARRQASATATLGQSEFYKGSGWNLCLFNTTTCWWTLPQQFNGSQAFSTTLAVPDGDWVFVLVAPYGGLFGNVTSMASPSVTNVSSFSVCRIGAPQCRPHHAVTTTLSCPSLL